MAFLPRILYTRVCYHKTSLFCLVLSNSPTGVVLTKMWPCPPPRELTSLETSLFSHLGKCYWHLMSRELRDASKHATVCRTQEYSGPKCHQFQSSHTIPFVHYFSYFKTSFLPFILQIKKKINHYISKFKFQDFSKGS